MIHKLKNISDENFSFEGVAIPKGGFSEELTPEVYQRLLALYYNDRLIPATEEEAGSNTVGVIADAEKPGQLSCEICGKEFGNEKGLRLHKNRAHK